MRFTHDLIKFIEIHITGDACFLHGSILPVTIPPRQRRGQVQPFGPGGGELFEAVLSRETGGKSKITSCCSCEVGHFSFDAVPAWRRLPISRENL